MSISCQGGMLNPDSRSFVFEEPKGECRGKGENSAKKKQEHSTKAYDEFFYDITGQLLSRFICSFAFIFIFFLLRRRAFPSKSGLLAHTMTTSIQFIYFIRSFIHPLFYTDLLFYFF
ncbi:hypothetical protein GGR50DRAFT_312635 [Xylaria sp. CBS 124048]|nr:hypothetical protein GGR50DRAFT_312635 [Xylaria sp. CBS 124048]